jgi:hypothetical protein
MDETDVVFKARNWISKVGILTTPIAIEDYLQHAEAELRREEDLGPDEPGWSLMKKDKLCICVNAHDRIERQRFTICHELAHFVLKLPSQHTLPSWSYKRPLGEILCDIFASELLLPYQLFKSAAEGVPISLASIDLLGSRFLASATATGSRFAALLSSPCAFVLSEQGKVRYASRSPGLREAGAWIPSGTEVPPDSVSHQVRTIATDEQSGTIDADSWFQNWERGGVLREEARQLRAWDQTLTLLWFDNLEIPSQQRQTDEIDREADELLPELDGVLRFKKRMRRT